ncbi:MAG: hypothetical protein J5629_00540 [Muribaculaceae bacterium]|nr:hypothetical protein [Muribaculaceae bacterium]
MKKIFTLFAAALVGLCAYAQDEGPCPSMFYFEPIEEVQEAACVQLELQITNASENLNGFNISIQKPDAAEWFMIDDIFEMYSTNEGYGHNILGMWTGHTEAQMEAAMSRMMDYNTAINDGKLVIVEILKTNNCRFFPVFETPAGVAKFAIDFTGCEDTREPLKVWADNTVPSECSFSYTGGVEGTKAWSPDTEPALLLSKVDGMVSKAAPTAISTINTDSNVDNRIFDLQGRELQSAPEHGVYIQNGKKYVK